MGLLSELYVASPADAAQYDESPEAFHENRAEFRGLTYGEFANLWAVLSDREPTESDSDAFETLLAVDERLINRFPDDFVARLGSLDVSELEPLAEKWVTLGELQYRNCSAQDVLPILEALTRLVAVAVREDKALYLWMCT